MSADIRLSHYGAGIWDTIRVFATQGCTDEAGAEACGRAGASNKNTKRNKPMLFLLPALIGGIASTTATTIGTAVGAATVAAGSATAAVGSAAAAVGSAAAAVGSAATTAATAVGGALGSIGATGGMSAVTKGVMGTVAKVAAVTATKKTSVDTVVQTVAMVAGALVGDKLVGKKRKQKDLPFMDVTPRRGSILKVDLAGGVRGGQGGDVDHLRLGEFCDFGSHERSSSRRTSFSRIEARLSYSFLPLARAMWSLA